MKNFFKNRLVINVFLLLCSLIISILITEYTCRFCVFLFERKMFDPHSFDRNAPSIHKKSQNKQIAFELRPNSQATQSGVVIRTNSEGWRDYEYDYFNKNEDTFRIVALGDSVTFGYGLELDNSWSKILERKLNATGKKHFEILNLGVCNYSIFQEAAVFSSKAINYSPDMAILFYSINDSVNEPIGGIYGYFYDPPSWLLYFMKRASDNLRWKFLRKIYKLKTGYKPRNKDEIKQFHLNKNIIRSKLKEIYETTGKDIKLLLVIQPMYARLQGDYEYPDVHKELRLMAEKLNYEVIDLFDYLKNYPEFEISLDICHPNEKGSRIISDIIFNKINSMGIIK